MDIWSKQKRSAVMARIRSRDTKPELIVRRYLFARGYRFRKNVRGLPGTPDIVMRPYGVAIFVHGCFWHEHVTDGHVPKGNHEFWARKIARNKERDERDKQALRAAGWDVVTVWECQLKPAVRRQTLLRLEACINAAWLHRHGRRPSLPYALPETDGAPSLAAEGEVDYACVDLTKQIKEDNDFISVRNSVGKD